MSTLTPNYGLIVPDGADTVEQVRADYATNLNTIDGIGGGGSGGHTIIDQSDNAMPSRTGLQFIGASVTDDSVNNKTVVTVTGGGGGVHYSTTEQVIGTWIDGKPLYAKTYHFTSGWVNDNWTDMADLSGLNIDTFIKSDFSVSRINSNLQYTGNGSIRPESSGQNHTISARYYSNHLQVMVNNYNDIVRLDITILYTKTTDVAGSGNWNTDGVPTVHYSTSEQVIGTWTNNKPLYQRTYSLTGGIVIGSYGHISLPADSIVRGFDGYAYRNSHASVNRFNGFINSGDLYVSIRSGQIEYWISNIFNPVEEIEFTVRYTKTTD